MKKYIKTTVFLAGLMIMGGAVQAEVPLFNFTLEVKDVQNPHVLLGKDRKPVHAQGPNTFNVPVGKSDYVFFVQYQDKGETREVRCPISGAPTLVTATIDPTKPSSEACMTQESNRKTGIVAL